MVEFYLLTFPRFSLRNKEHTSYFGKNRTHDFRTSRCAVYLLDHSGDECVPAEIQGWQGKNVRRQRSGNREVQEALHVLVSPQRRNRPPLDRRLPRAYWIDKRRQTCARTHRKDSSANGSPTTEPATTRTTGGTRPPSSRHQDLRPPSRTTPVATTPPPVRTRPTVCTLRRPQQYPCRIAADTHHCQIQRKRRRRSREELTVRAPHPSGADQRGGRHGNCGFRVCRCAQILGSGRSAPTRVGVTAPVPR